MEGFQNYFRSTRNRIAIAFMAALFLAIGLVAAFAYPASGSPSSPAVAPAQFQQANIGHAVPSPAPVQPPFIGHGYAYTAHGHE
jgi:hypothetical protein